MDQVVCPKCRASIEPDLLSGRKSAECPFCGGDLSEIAGPAAAGEFGPTSEADSAHATSLARAWGVPAGSKIHIAQSDSEKLVLYIPPGGKGTAFMGCFALAWNVFMIVFTAIWFGIGAAGNQAQGNPPPLIVLILFLALFWAVGLGMFYGWLRLKFTRSILLLDKERFAIQRTFFNRKWIKETQLDSDSRAELRESHSENDKPIYKVAVTGADKKSVNFGTALAHEEKVWLVDTLNRFIGIKDGYSGIAASDHQAHVVPAIRPEELPDASGLRVIESSQDKLVVELPILSPFARMVFLIPLLVVEALWVIPLASRAFNQMAAPQGMGVGVVLLAMFVIPSILTALFVLVIFFGKTTIELDRQHLRRTRQFGPLKSVKEIGTPSIRRVYVPLFAGARDSTQVPVPASRRKEISKGISFCMVETSAAEPFTLTLFQNVKAAHNLAGLLQHQLEQMGILGPDVAADEEKSTTTSP